MSKATAIRTGAGPKFLLSSLLRCGHCGSSYAIAGRDIYKCSGHTSGGPSLCTNDAFLYRQTAEAEVLAGIKRKLSSREAIQEICSRVRAELRKPKPKTADNSVRIAQLKCEIENIADAIAGGVMRPSATLANRLSAAEGELGRLEQADVAATAPAADVSLLLAGLPALARRKVDRLEETLAAGDIPRARQEIRDHVGLIKVEADETEIRLFSERGKWRPPFFGQPEPRVGFEPSTFGL